MTNNLKQKAITLRRQGLTYREIQATIPVAKSTLSGWVGDITLSSKQQKRITKLRIAGRKKASYVRKKTKNDKLKQIQKQANIDLQSISKQELWVMSQYLLCIFAIKKLIFN